MTKNKSNRGIKLLILTSKFLKQVSKWKDKQHTTHPHLILFFFIKQHILHMTMEKKFTCTQNHKKKIVKINFYFLFFVSKTKIKIRVNKHI